MTDQELIQIAWEAVLEKKGRDPVLLDLQEVSRITDFFLVTGAENGVQAKAIADRIVEVLMEHGLEPLRKEGYQHGSWILLDYGFLVIHVLLRTERDFYRLEQLWHDAKPVNMPLY